MGLSISCFLLCKMPQFAQTEAAATRLCLPKHSSQAYQVPSGSFTSQTCFLICKMGLIKTPIPHGPVVTFNEIAYVTGLLAWNQRLLNGSYGCAHAGSTDAPVTSPGSEVGSPGSSGSTVPMHWPLLQPQFPHLQCGYYPYFTGQL